MFNPSRNQARQFFIDAWRKHRAGESLSALEAVAAELVGQHPEYHALLDAPDAADKDFAPEDGQINPFLHLSLHLAIHEQLTIDQPPGIRRAYDACLARHAGDRHAALHVLLESLGETVWESQRNRLPLDAAAYLERIRRRNGEAAR